MNHITVPWETVAGAHRPIRRKLLCLFVMIGCSAMLAQTPAGSSTGAAPAGADASSIHATHILGLQGISGNAGGKLSIEGDALKFQKTEGSEAQVPIGSIQDVSLGTEDRQVGGVPMTLGKAAVPFGGGRAIGLFSHKKYDTLTLEYLDSDGGVHGAIFEISKGKAEAFKSELVAKGAHVRVADQTAASTPEVKK